MNDKSNEFNPAELPADVDVENLRGNVTKPIELQKLGFLTRSGVMDKITFTAPIKEIAERLTSSACWPVTTSTSTAASQETATSSSSTGRTSRSTCSRTSGRISG